MSPLTLTPIPSLRSSEQSHPRRIEEDGFVDESAVRAMMLIQSAPFRRQSSSNDLALASDDLDFAGWHAPRQTPVSGPPPPVLLAKSAAPQLAKTKPLAFVPSPVTRISRRKSPSPKKSRSWIPTIAGILTLALSFILIAILVAERDFTFQSIVKKIFHLPAASEKFDEASATRTSQSIGED